MALRDAIIAAAERLGISPVDLATVISYETGGTFNPAQPGPTTKWGQHRGLIQWGEPQARKYGVDFNDPARQMDSVVSYLADAGVKPGMGILDLYSAVNAGRVGRYNASDAHAGGAPGTVRDKVTSQMSGHRQKAAQLLGGDYTPAQSSPAPASAPQTAASSFGSLVPDYVQAAASGQPAQQERMSPMQAMLMATLEQQAPAAQMPAPMPGNADPYALKRAIATAPGPWGRLLPEQWLRG